MAEIQLPAAFQFLWADKADDGSPVRYRCAYGGRGSAKSMSFAIALVLKAASAPLRILCTREIQGSIKDSVKAEIELAIQRAGLEGFYTVLDTEIRGRNGSLFTFAGLRHNATAIKSKAGIDIAWVEEADTVSQASIDILDPTIRKPGSEIWFTWNPRNATDPVDVMFRGDPPPGSIVRRVNWNDNPWFGETELVRKLEWDRERDPDKYAHVWLGEYNRNSEARVFRNWRVEAFETPADAVFRFGADWGFGADPSVLVRGFIEGRTLYIDHCVSEAGVETDFLPFLFGGTENDDLNRRNAQAFASLTSAQKDKWTGIPGATRWTITADSARPETVSYMRRHGFKIVSAIKGRGSLEDGIEFLKAFDIVVHPRCQAVESELIAYIYKTDPLTGEVLPVLEDKDNHTIDALRYALEALRRAGKKPLPPPPPKKRDAYAITQDSEESWKTA